MFRIDKDLADKFVFRRDKKLWCYYSKEINPDEIMKVLTETSYFLNIPKDNILRDSRNLLALYKFSINTGLINRTPTVGYCSGRIYPTCVFRAINRTATVEKKEFILKKFSNKTPSEWLKYGLRTSKAIRGWKKAYEFLRRNINTPQPFLLLEKRLAGFLIYSCLLVEKINDFVPLRETLTKYRKDTNGILQGEKKIFLTKLAKYVSDMHNSGIVHRDLSGGNVLIQNAYDLDKIKFTVIDINRARIKKILSINDRMKDLERIRIEPDDRLFFFQNYCDSNEMFERYKAMYLMRLEQYRYKRKHKPFMKKLFGKLFE